MANELSITYQGTANIYVIIRRQSDGYVWDTVAVDWAAWADGDIANYDLALTSYGGDYYAVGFPSAIAADTVCRIIYYKRAGAAPALTDLVLATEEGTWTGTVTETTAWGTGTTNTYISRTDADTYFSTRYNTDDWDRSTDTEKTAALVEATQAIDRLNFCGDKYDADQTLEFPRGDDTTVPAAIQEANAEEAARLLSGVDPQDEFDDIFVTAHSFAGAKVTYDRRNPPIHIAAGIMSINAWRLLLPWLRDPRTMNLSRVS